MAKSYTLGGMVGLIVVAAASAQAQTDLGAGMSISQLFAANCAACHRSPQGLSRGRDAATLAYFLRDHYTTRPATAAALASYLASIRGPARQPAAPPAQGSEQAAAPAVRTRPLEKLANATVERLKSFVADSDPAKPFVPDAPDRGVARLLSYSSSGVAVDSLREDAMAATSRAAHRLTPEQGRSPAAAAPPPGADQPLQKDAGDSGKGAGKPSQAYGSGFPLRGPPPSSAMPSTQSNEDRR